MKLLKGYYTFFYNVIYVSKQFSFIIIYIFPNNTKRYFSFNNIDDRIDCRFSFELKSTFLLCKNHLIPILLVGNDFQRHLQCSKMLLLMKEVKKQCLVEELEWGGSYKHYGEKLLPRFVDLGVMHLLPVQCESYCFRTTTNCSLFTKSSNQETQQDCYEYHSLS